MVSPLGYQEGINMIRILSGEIGFLTRVLLLTPDKKDPEQLFFGIRMSVRVIPSLFEAYCGILKGRILEVESSTSTLFSEKEREVLLEGRNHQGQGGTVTFKPQMIRPARNVRCTLRCYARVRGIESPIGSTGDVPDHFKVTVSLRNRITHAKQPSDFDFTQEEVKHAQQTIIWLAEVIEWVMKSEIAYIRRINEDFA